MVNPPNQGEKKVDLGRWAIMLCFILFTIVFGLVVGRQALDQGESADPMTSPAVAEGEPSVPPLVLPDPKTPQVSRQAKPKGWVDLKTDDLREIMALPGMTLARARGILQLRTKKPDLTLEDLLTVPGITQADLDSWREFIWEGA